MLNVFISYERESKRLVGPLADDIKVLGHTVWFDQELIGALGLLGLAIEPYDAKTGENLWAYGLLGLTLIVVLPGLMLQRVAIRIRQRNAHRRARAEHHGDLFQGQASRMA